MPDNLSSSTEVQNMAIPVGETENLKQIKTSAEVKATAPVFRSRFKKAQPNLKAPGSRLSKQAKDDQFKDGASSKETIVSEKLLPSASSEFKEKADNDIAKSLVAIRSTQQIPLKNSVELTKSIALENENVRESEDNNQVINGYVSSQNIASKSVEESNASHHITAESIDNNVKSTDTINDKSLGAINTKYVNINEAKTVDTNSVKTGDKDGGVKTDSQKLDKSDISSSHPVQLQRTRFKKAQPNLKSLGNRFSKPLPVVPQQKEPETPAVQPESAAADKQNSSLPNVDSSAEQSVPATPSSNSAKNDFPYLTSLLKSPKKRIENKEIVNKRKRYAKGENPPERSKMTMMDLIYWNPSSSPMMKCSNKIQNVEKEPTPIGEDESSSLTPPESNAGDEVGNMPGPRLVVGENGEIIIDEESLIIRRTAPEIDPSTTNAVFEDNNTTYSSFRKQIVKRGWSNKETAKFYKALSVVGTDFSLMENLLPNRSRRELKLKFKREEKQNTQLIDKVLYDPQKFDISVFEEDNEIEELNEECSSKPQKRKRKSKKVPQDDENQAPRDENVVPNNRNTCKRYGKKKRVTISDVIETENSQASKSDNVPVPSNGRKTILKNSLGVATEENQTPRNESNKTRKRKRKPTVIETSDEEEDNSNIDCLSNENSVDNSLAFEEIEANNTEKSLDSGVEKMPFSSDVQSVKALANNQSDLYISTTEISKSDRNKQTPTRINTDKNAKVQTLLMPADDIKKFAEIGTTTEQNVQIVFFVDQGIHSSGPPAETNGNDAFELMDDLDDRSTSYISNEALQDNGSEANVVQDSEPDIKYGCLSDLERLCLSTDAKSEQQKDAFLENKKNSGVEDHHILVPNEPNFFAEDSNHAITNAFSIQDLIPSEECYKSAPGFCNRTPKTNSKVSETTKHVAVPESTFLESKKNFEEEDHHILVPNEPNFFAADSNHAITNVFSIQDIIPSEECNKSDTGFRNRIPKTISKASETTKRVAVQESTFDEISPQLEPGKLYNFLANMDINNFITNVTSVQEVTTSEELTAGSRTKNSKLNSKADTTKQVARRRKKPIFAPRLNPCKNSDSSAKTTKPNRRQNDTSETLESDSGTNITKPTRKQNGICSTLASRCANFTPAEQFPNYSEKNLEFTPGRGKTYQRKKVNMATQGTPGLIHSSLETHDFTPKNTDLINGTLQTTTLNNTLDKTFSIPLTPSPCGGGTTSINQSPGPMMLFAQSPCESNVLHVFMYKNAFPPPKNPNPAFSESYNKAKLQPTNGLNRSMVEVNRPAVAVNKPTNKIVS